MHSRFHVVFIVSTVISIFPTFVVPLYVVAKGPAYSARFAYEARGRPWLVDQRFGTTTFVSSTESPHTLGVMVIPISGDPFRYPTARDDSNPVIVQQELGWPIASMFWSARLYDLPGFDSPDPMPTDLAIGSRGFGGPFTIRAPRGDVSYYLHAAYWPGSFSYAIILFNVLSVASTISILWMTTTFAWRQLKRAAVGRGCASCGYQVDRNSRTGICPECGHNQA